MSPSVHEVAGCCTIYTAAVYHQVWYARAENRCSAGLLLPVAERGFYLVYTHALGNRSWRVGINAGVPVDASRIGTES